MKIGLSQQRFELSPPQTLRLSRARGAVVTCVHGAVWLTQDDDPRDVILEPGQRFVIDGNRLALVSPFEPSRVTVQEPRAYGMRSRSTARQGAPSAPWSLMGRQSSS